MPINLIDRLSIKFHRLTGGNIPSSAAIRWAKKVSSIDNIPDEIMLALDKKHKKHPLLVLPVYIERSFLAKGNKMLEKCEQQEMRKIDENKILISDFENIRGQLARRVLLKDSDFNIKDYIDSQLRKRYSIDLNTHGEITKEVVSLMTQLDEEGNKLKNIVDEQIKTSAKPATGLYDAGVLVYEEIAVHLRMAEISGEIHRLEEDVRRNNAIIATVTAEVTKAFDNFIPHITRKHVRDDESLVRARAAAPDVIMKAEGNIEKIQSMKRELGESTNKRVYVTGISAFIKSTEAESKALSNDENLPSTYQSLP